MAHYYNLYQMNLEHDFKKNKLVSLKRTSQGKVLSYKRS